ncbi:MAG: CAP domain-containing protein [Verrucomicrobia bacterium]|nr:CAP domain-containing protein [Verrucomicrobiota bacterium]
MKHFVRPLVLSGAAMLLSAGIGLSAGTNNAAGVKTAPGADKYILLSSNVLEELNLSRTKPVEYARYVEAHLGTFIDDNTYEHGGQKHRVNEGKKAVQEAIDFLKKVKPVSSLKDADGLAGAAQDHVEDIGPLGIVGHVGSDKSKPEDRMKRYGAWEKTCGENVAFGLKDARAFVIQLIVDDSVPDRGHRKNIFNPDFRLVGVAAGPHKEYGLMCAMDFAGVFKEKKKRKPTKKEPGDGAGQ